MAARRRLAHQVGLQQHWRDVCDPRVLRRQADGRGHRRAESRERRYLAAFRQETTSSAIDEIAGKVLVRARSSPLGQRGVREDPWARVEVGAAALGQHEDDVGPRRESDAAGLAVDAITLAGDRLYERLGRRIVDLEILRVRGGEVASVGT